MTSICGNEIYFSIQLHLLNISRYFPFTDSIRIITRHLFIYLQIDNELKWNQSIIPQPSEFHSVWQLKKILKIIQRWNEPFEYGNEPRPWLFKGMVKEWTASKEKESANGIVKARDL